MHLQTVIPLVSMLLSTSQGPVDLMKVALHQATLQKTHKPLPYSEHVATIKSVRPQSRGTKKVSIVGCGQVGLAVAYAMLNQGVPGTIALVDMDGSKLEGEAKDLRQGSAFHNRVRIEASTKYDITENSNLVIVAAGAARKGNESRLDLMKKNVSIMKSIIPEVIEKSPHAAICIVANPCDIITAVAAKIAGPRIPPGQIFGSGTCLDSSRLRSLIAQMFDLDTQSVHGFIIGEHGDSSVPVWSSISIGGVPLLTPGGVPEEMHKAAHREVVETAKDVILKKGYTNWAIGLAVSHIASAVLQDQRKILPVTTCVRGFAGIKEDVFLSLPCVVGSQGVTRVIDLPLTSDEVEQFLKSAKNVWEVQSEIWDSL